jgi:hypothetical protein
VWGALVEVCRVNKFFQSRSLFFFFIKPKTYQPFLVFGQCHACYPVQFCFINVLVTICKNAYWGNFRGFKLRTTFCLLLAVSGPQYRRGSGEYNGQQLQPTRLQDVYLDTRYHERFALFVRGGADNSWKLIPGFNLRHKSRRVSTMLRGGGGLQCVIVSCFNIQDTLPSGRYIEARKEDVMINPLHISAETLVVVIPGYTASRLIKQSSYYLTICLKYFWGHVYPEWTGTWTSLSEYIPGMTGLVPVICLKCYILWW